MHAHGTTRAPSACFFSGTQKAPAGFVSRNIESCGVLTEEDILRIPIMLADILVFALAAGAANGLSSVGSRRSVVVGGLSSAVIGISPTKTAAEVPVDPFNSMCLGFGCNSVKGVELSSGTPKPTDEESMSWADFLAAIDEKKVARVDFFDVNMQKAYAVLNDDVRILIGEGYPIEAGNSWSSTTFVARILNNNKVPYTFLTELKRRV